MTELSTPRLLLRQWRDSDLEPFAAMNADPEVMRYFPATLSREESDAFAERARLAIDERGWGLWAVEVTSSSEFIGYVGLLPPRFEAHFTPALEVGWRLARHAWGHGYATEGGRAAVGYAFDALGLDEIVSFTATGNLPSRKVMERLGFTHDPADDFDHPFVAAGPLRRHVLYRLART